MKIFGGIDPGITGALAFYCPETRFLAIHDVPTYGITVGKKIRKRIDIPSTLAILGDHGEDRVTHLHIEKVWGQPRDTPVTAFILGETYGALRACLAAAHVPFTEVTPQSWQGEFGLRGKRGDRGEAARKLASELLPEHAGFFRRKMDHNRAEAALIALHAAGEARK